jgi:hypothetical protein
MWVWWDLAEPAPGSYFEGYLDELERQVVLARNAGVGVILCNWRFPRWANGTQNATDADLKAWELDRGNKELVYRYPLERGTDSPWGRWISHLIQRFAKFGNGLVLELFNEPNLQWWPQQDSGGNMLVHVKVAEMMVTAKNLSAFFGDPNPIAGPATSDVRGASTRGFSNYASFIPGVKSELQRLGWNGAPYHAGKAGGIWTHHDYIDLHREEMTSYNVALNALRGWWRGWSPDGTNPGIFVTESGAPVAGTTRNVSREEQARLVNARWNRLGPVPSAQLWTNYLLYSDPIYDTGLREPRKYGGAARPVFSTFRQFPGWLGTG